MLLCLHLDLRAQYINSRRHAGVLLVLRLLENCLRSLQLCLRSLQSRRSSLRLQILVSYHQHDQLTRIGHA